MPPNGVVIIVMYIEPLSWGGHSLPLPDTPSVENEHYFGDFKTSRHACLHPTFCVYTQTLDSLEHRNMLFMATLKQWQKGCRTTPFTCFRMRRKTKRGCVFNWILYAFRSGKTWTDKTDEWNLRQNLWAQKWAAADEHQSYKQLTLTCARKRKVRRIMLSITHICGGCRWLWYDCAEISLLQFVNLNKQLKLF